MKIFLFINLTFSTAKFSSEQKYFVEVYFWKVDPAYKLRILVRSLSEDIYYILLSDFWFDFV